MCEICRQTPCDARCPNATEPKCMGKCIQCGTDLREDYNYYEDCEGNLFCSEECALEFHEIDEKEW